MKIKRFLVLTGSGEFTSRMEETDKYILRLINKNSRIKNPKKIKVAIIPTAAGKEKDYRKWIDMGVRHFNKLGAVADGIEVTNKKDANNKKFSEAIKGFQAFYLSGGDPGHLYHSLKGTLFWKNIYNAYKKGAILAGSSAGAMIMGNYVISNVYQTFENNKDPVWEKGFNLVPFAIIPHYDYVQSKEKIKYLKMLARTPVNIKKNLLGIDEDTPIFLNFAEDKFEIKGYGNVTVIKNGDKQILKSGSQYPLNIFKSF